MSREGAPSVGVVSATRLVLFLHLGSMDLFAGVFRFHTIIFF